MKKHLFFLLVMLWGGKSVGSPLYLATAANSSYYNHLLNFIGSVQKVNYNELNKIMVFDLGLSQSQVQHLKKISKVSVHSLKECPNLTQFYRLPNGYRVLGWYAWKPIVMKKALEEVPYVVWMDAGTTVLRPIDHLFDYVKNHGYFLSTIGNEIEHGKYKHPVGWGVTRFVGEAFNLYSPENNWILSQEFVMGGIIGVSKESQDKFLTTLYELTNDLRYYQDDGTTPNGWGTGRHDQALLSILSYMKNLKIFKQDYMQNIPMQLTENKELYITWHPNFVCAKTHIYSSRSDIKNLEHFKQYIRYN